MTEKSLTELVGYSVDHYIKDLLKLNQADERIAKMLEYMKLQLSHGEIHPLSRFWKMRKFCLDHFKGSIAVSQRLILWKEYCQVIDEIVKLKELIDEKSAFEKQQIEQALSSVASDLENIDQVIEREASISVPKCPCISNHAEFYQTTQKELSVYSSYAKRLNALKKEILALDISFKKKQEILDQIHKLADLVFPKKRDLLGLMSRTYAGHIQNFVRLNFSSETFKSPIFQLKEQIKQLQNFAKIISLNVDAFSKTREQLSDCWDRLKLHEKKQKKEKEEKKEQSSKVFTTLEEKIEKLKAEKGSLPPAKFHDEFKHLSRLIQKEDLIRFQRKQLQDKLEVLHDEKEGALPSAQESATLSICSQLSGLIEKVHELDYQVIQSSVGELFTSYDSSQASDSQNIQIERSLYTLYESLGAKLSKELKDCLDFEALSIKVENFKKSVKENIERYRRALGSSNQSIEKAMAFNELLVQSRALLTSLEEKLLNHQADS